MKQSYKNVQVDAYYDIRKIDINGVIAGIDEAIENESSLVINKILIGADVHCHVLNCVLHKVVHTVEEMESVVINSLCNPSIRPDGHIWYPKCDIFVYFKTKGE